MKIYLNQNVFDAALERIRYLFDEFPLVCVNFSGGKDSTVVLNLALQVAEEKGRLPLPVMFIDQEAEWQAVIDYIRIVMHDPRILPYWLQIPIKLFNATSHTENWLYCWEQGKESEWMRIKEEDSIHVNRYGTDRFADLFTKFLAAEFPSKACHLGGVRCEESPARALGLTTYATYKHITYGKIENKRQQHFAFYPIYDWSYTDVWKAIHVNKWSYCSVYDKMYQYGVPVTSMRVSNLHHETAVDKLFFLQEVEPDTWQKLTERLTGINTAGQLGKRAIQIIDKLPYMFTDWKEYRDYLLVNLITEKSHRVKFQAQFDSLQRIYDRGDLLIKNTTQMYKAQINAMLVNDIEGSKLATYKASHQRFRRNKPCTAL